MTLMLSEYFVLCVWIIRGVNKYLYLFPYAYYTHFYLIITLTIFIFFKYNLNLIFTSWFQMMCLNPPQVQSKTAAGHNETATVQIKPPQDTF